MFEEHTLFLLLTYNLVGKLQCFTVMVTNLAIQYKKDKDKEKTKVVT